MSSNEIQKQRDYYASTAGAYNEMHVQRDIEHDFALAYLVGILEFLQIESILDVGSGTGRALSYIMNRKPNIKVTGIEPVQQLREIGYEKGIPQNILVEGDALNLEYPDASVDLVCEFGVLHHIRQPELAVSEMLRVASKAVFISDSNRFGQGAFFSRLFKTLLASAGLWSFADYIKTRGKGYTFSDGDGVAYSYSVFDNYDQIRRACSSIHIVNTCDAGTNPFFSSPHVALLGIKRNPK